MTDLNRRFAGLCGIRWKGPRWENGFNYDDNPNFISDPRLVLREMIKRKDFYEFMETVGRVEAEFECNTLYYIDIAYINDTTGLLVKAALERIEKVEDNHERTYLFRDKRCRRK